MLTIDRHWLLDLRAFVTTFPRPLRALPTPPESQTLLALHGPAPLRSHDAIRDAA